MPLTEDAIKYTHDRFYENVVEYDAEKLPGVHQVIRLAGKLARRNAQSRGAREIDTDDLERAIIEVQGKIQGRHFFSICKCGERTVSK